MAWIAVLLCSPVLSHAANLLEFQIADLKGSDWSATGVQAELELAVDKQIHATLLVSRLRIAGLAEAVHDVRVYCPALVLSAGEVACEGASITGRFPYLERQQLSADLRYGRSNGRLQGHVYGISLAGGRLDLGGDFHPAGWQIELAGRGIDAGKLLTQIDSFTETDSGVTLAGNLNWDLDVSSRGAAPPLIEGTVEFTSIGASNDQGTLASDALAGSIEVKVHGSNSGWRFELMVRPVAGQLYVEPIFLDVGAQPFSFSLAGSWYRVSDVLSIETFLYRQPKVGQVTGTMHVDLQPEWNIRQMDARFDKAKLPEAYDIYLSPLLFGTELDALQSTGSFDAHLSIEEGNLRALRVELEQVYLDDDEGRFAVYGLDGDVLWRAQSGRAQEASPLSKIRWEGGFVYGVQVGAGEIGFLTHDKDFTLLDAVRLPVLDGGLMIHLLKMSRFGQPDMRIEFDARIDPISLQALTAALGWPVFGGTLSGTLPQLNYELGELTLGGNLEAQVFDGEISVENLKITEPFGLVPQLSANIFIRDLDLEKVTETFSFGKITGLLDGEIRDLHMLDWEPTAFDTRFQTPEKDATRRRISQRAIENISSLSGQSVTAVLSSGFLRFFDDFAYDKIALSCRLENGVCFTGALLSQGERYYIVKGKGLPRIDVIGYSRRVAWPVLIERLRSIHYEEAVID